MNRFHPITSVVLSSLVAACGTSGGGSSDPLQGEWVWLYSRGLYFDSIVHSGPGQRTVLTMGGGEFTLLDGRGRYEIGDAQIESASGIRGPLLRFSETPAFLGDSDFVFRLQADTLFLLTVIDDFTDYVFVRGQSQGDGQRTP